MLNNGSGYNPICCKSKPFHTTYMVCDDQIQVQLFHQLLDKILYGVVNTEYLKIKARMLMLLNLKIKHICHSDQIQFKTMHWNAYWFDITQLFWKIALEKTLVNFQAFLLTSGSMENTKLARAEIWIFCIFMSKSSWGGRFSEEKLKMVNTNLNLLVTNNINLSWMYLRSYIWY